MIRASVAVLLLLAATVAAAQEESAELAQARIEKHRKGDVVVRVEAEGRPAAGAKVEIAQTAHAFLFGANIFALRPDAKDELQVKYQERFKGILNYATLPFYWGSYERERGKTDEARLRRMAEWCRGNGIRVKGHPVVWQEVFPKWVTAQEAMEPLIEKRVTETIGRFKGLVDRWDVVNESLAAPRFENPYGAWVKGATPVDAVEKCLRWAARANPEGIFLVNDYDTSPAYEKELAALRERRAPFHAVGIQSHMHAGEWGLHQTWTTCERFAKTGLPLHFTEVTVLSGPREKPMKDYQTQRKDWATTPEEELRQADYVEKFYTVLFSHPSVEAITWWDLSDHGAWLGAPAGLVRRDMSPKPAYERLGALIKGAWWTKRAEAVTGGDGRAQLRGFLGSYACTVTLPDGRKKEATFDLQKGDPRPVDVKF